MDLFTFKKFKSAEGPGLVDRLSWVRGDYWEGCSDEEMEQTYPIEVKEFHPAKKLTGSSMLLPVIGFLCTGEAAELNPTGGKLMWMTLDSFSRYDVQYLKANPPLPPPPPPRQSTPSHEGEPGKDDDDDDDVVMADEEKAPKEASKVKLCFEPGVLKSTKISVKQRAGHPVQVTEKQFEFRCKDDFCGPKCGKKTRLQWGTSTGALSKHIQKDHPQHWKKMIMEGTLMGPSKFVVIDGKVVARLSFEESFPNHVAFVVMCYLDGVPFNRSRSKGTRYFCQTLAKGYFPPHRETSINVLEVVDELMDEEMDIQLAVHIKKVGGQCVGEQFDMMTKHGVSYVSLNGSIIVDDPKKGLYMLPFQMSYSQFPFDRHTGENIAVWLKETNAKHGVDLDRDVGTPTIDGASNGKRAMTILKKEVRICSAHQMARAVAYATGDAGKKNADARKLIRAFRRLAAFAHKSTRFNDDQKKAQVTLRLVEKPKIPLELIVAGATRWDGVQDTMARSVEVLQPALIQALAANDHQYAIAETTEQAFSSDEEFSSDGDNSDSSKDSLSDDSDFGPATKRKKKKNASSLSGEKKYEAQLLKYRPSLQQWSDGHALVAVLKNPRSFDKLIQTSNNETTHMTLPLVRAVIKITTTKKVQVSSWERHSASGALKLAHHRVAADTLPQVVQTARETLVEELEERFFSPWMIPDRDLLAMMLNPQVDIKSVTNSEADALRARRLYAQSFREIAAEKGIAPPSGRNRVKAKRFRSSNSGGLSLLDIAMTQGSISSDEDNDGGNNTNDAPDDTARPMTEMDQLDAIRLNPEHPEMELANDGGVFSALRFHSMNRISRPVHVTMAQRFLADQSTEAVSERSFSSAGMYHSPLRKSLGPVIASSMTKCNKNHDWLFEKIKPKIWQRYLDKYRNTSGALDIPNPDYKDDDGT
jgi:hypothetical protein